MLCRRSRKRRKSIANTNRRYGAYAFACLLPSSIQTITVGSGVRPDPPAYLCSTTHQAALRQLRLATRVAGLALARPTADREFHPALKVIYSITCQYSIWIGVVNVTVKLVTSGANGLSRRYSWQRTRHAVSVQSHSNFHDGLLGWCFGEWQREVEASTRLLAVALRPNASVVCLNDVFADCQA